MKSLNIIDYIKLVRYKNLIAIIFFQVLMYYGIVLPILDKYQMGQACYGSLEFILLVCSSIFIAAGGYAINEYFDTKIDMINRPEKVIVGKTISRKSAATYFQILIGIGTLCGLILAYLVRDIKAGFIFIIIPGLLWFYSGAYKRQFLIGNIIIGFCAAMSIFLVGYIECSVLSKMFGPIIFETPIVSEIYSWVGGFSLFAFLLTMIREIVKDVEDIEGDREMECRTMPIVWGIKKTKIFLYVLTIATVALIGFFAFTKIHFAVDNITKKYFIFGILLPFIAFLYLIFKAKGKNDFHQASSFCKYMMIIGSLYSVFVYFLFTINF